LIFLMNPAESGGRCRGAPAAVAPPPATPQSSAQPPGDRRKRAGERASLAADGPFGHQALPSRARTRE